MNSSSDPAVHRHREQQLIQHVQGLLSDERLRVDTTQGRRPVTAFVRDVNKADRALDLKRLMTEMNVPDRELMSRMPVGEMLEVALTQTRWFFFNQTVGRVRVVCVSPARDILAGTDARPMTATEVQRTLAAMPPSLGGVPLTVVLCSTSGFVPDAREMAERRADRTVILVEPNGVGGWTASGPPDSKNLAELFDPEAEHEKYQRVRNLIEESKLELVTGGLTVDKLAAKAQMSPQIVESAMKDYAQQNPGLSAKRLDGRLVLFREGSGSSASSAIDSGGSMGLIDKVRSLFGRTGENKKKIAFLSEKRAGLSLQRDRAYEEMGVLEEQEAGLKQQFKDASGAITKRRITSQMLQLRKDLERRQQLLTVLNQQINVVSTHLHNLELVQQGQGAALPDSGEITEDAVKAEEMLANLEADSELAGSVGQVATSGMSEEEKALYEELERETGDQAPAEEPMADVTIPKAKSTEKPTREPAARTTTPREPQAGQAAAPAATPGRRAEPEAG